MAAAQTSGPSRTRDLRNTSGACASDTAAETGVTAYERCRWTGNSRHFIKDLFTRTARLGLSSSTVIASEEPPAGFKENKGTSFFQGVWVFTPWTGAEHRCGWCREFHFGGVASQHVPPEELKVDRLHLKAKSVTHLSRRDLS